MERFTAPLTAVLEAHWPLLMTLLGCWIAIATVFARAWPKPPLAASRWARAAHFVFIDLPSLLATLNGKTWMGLTFSIPFVTWTARDKDGGGVLRAILPLVFLTALVGVGCSPAQKQAAGRDLQKTMAVLHDIGTVAKDEATCAPETVQALLAAFAGAPGWVNAILQDIECVYAAARQAYADITAGHMPAPSLERVQVIRSLQVLLRPVPTAALPGARPLLDCTDEWPADDTYCNRVAVQP